MHEAYSWEKEQRPSVDLLHFADEEAGAPPHRTCTGPVASGLKLALLPERPWKVLTGESEFHTGWRCSLLGRRAG